ncbi:hypothetical protein LX95_01046 [Mesonia algae]|jgi:hypothetical protein|uniref:Uncharacterized protein n=1 Tax=Mesonia algae TaxID=213248 RepID=A0A2W7I8R0_9FLAO|nr:DUF6520 family protein [Mesonia algae]PZW42729.1 hypothetical protein LX95_01046 [Mesonia algae]
MKSKFLIPVLAMIFATGMSFTTAELGKEQAVDYIRVDNQWMAIPEIDCGQVGPNNCRAKLQDGSVHPIYDIQNLSSLKKTTSTVPFPL